MNTRIYKDARRNNVTAKTAAMIAADSMNKCPLKYEGDSHTERGVTYALEISQDDLSVFDHSEDLQQYTTRDTPPEGALIISEPDRHSYGAYMTRETWADFWPSETDPKARAWMFERHAALMRELLENGYSVVTVTATDKSGRELHSSCVGGFDDAQYGAAELFDEVRTEVARIRRAARAERREIKYWNARDIVTIGAQGVTA